MVQGPSRPSRVLSLAASLLAASGAAASDFDVVLSEVHYRPFGPGEPTFEFVEVHNRGGTAVDLGGWRFSDGIDFTFPPGTALDPGAYLAVSPRAASLRAVSPGAAVVGDYAGRLDNSGEIVVLSNREGRPISWVHFGDGGAWSSLPDALGPSLECLLPAGDVDRPQAWAPSRRFGGTPGEPNTRRRGEYPYTGRDPRPAVRLNEVRAAAAGGDGGFIEIHNSGGAGAEVGGFRIVSSDGPSHTLPPGTRIPARGFLVLTGGELGFLPPAATAAYALLGADGTTWVDTLEAPAVPPGFASGRFPDGEGGGNAFPPSPGEPNAAFPDDRVILNEVFFAPRYEAPSAGCVEDCSDRHPWVELHNRSGVEVSLSGWRLDGGIQFAFAQGTEISPEGHLVVAASRAVFEKDHPGVAAAAGEWRGALGRREDRIILRDELGNAADVVRYGNGDPYNDTDGDGRDDGSFQGSDWPTDVSDSGRSIELASPFLENAAGRAWRLGPPGGTPGTLNAAYEADPLPVVAAVMHSPPIPDSSTPVTVTCRAHAADQVASVELVWKVDGAPASARTAMRDDGASGDGAALDSVYGATIPPQSHQAIVAFQIAVTSASGRSALYPPKAPRAAASKHYLYEVDDDPPLGNGSVDYRIVLSRADLTSLQTRSVQSDVLLPATFIGDGEVHHQVGVRYRGENSRNLDRKSYRVEFRPEDRFQGYEKLNLNASNRAGGIEQTAYRDQLSSDLFRRMGIPYVQEWPVNFHFQGGVGGNRQGRPNVDPFYIRKEHFDRDYLERYFGPGGGGNLYRALDPGGGSGDLSYEGEDPRDYAPFYEKRSNRDEDDYSDLIELCRASDRGQTPDAAFEDEILRLVDVEQWGRFFAVQDYLTNIDGGIQTNNGEDYLLYHVPIDAPRPDAGLWLILPWDLEETFSDANAGLFLTSVAAARRFLRHPTFAPFYLKGLRELSEVVAARQEVRARAVPLAEALYAERDAAGVASAIETYVLRRNALILDQVPAGIQVAAEVPAAPGTEVISEGDAWSYFRGRREPSGGTLEWAGAGFADASWPKGPSGFGYGDGDDATQLDDMEQRGGEPGYYTLYIRRAFQVADPAAVTGLSLVVDYDDAFVAYLNGAEVARSPNLVGAGAPGDPIPFDLELGDSVNHEASRGNNNPNAPETYPIADFRSLLQAGENVLALQGFNSTRDSSDFSLIPELLAVEGQASSGGGWGSEVFVTGPTARLQGTADAARAGSLRLNGELATITARPPGPGAPHVLAWRAAVPVAPGANRVRIEAFAAQDGSGPRTAVEEVLVHRMERGFTSADGSIAGAVEWTRDGGPYRVASGTRVPAGAVLTLRPGARVLLGPSAAIDVAGRLEIDGSAEDPVRLQPFDLGGRPAGIVLDRTGAGDGDPLHVIRHAALELVGRTAGAAVAVNGSRLLVEGCRFASTGQTAIDASGGSRLEVRDARFEGIRDGIVAQGSTVMVSGSAFRGMAGDRDAIRLRGNGPERSRMEDCLIEDSGDDGIDIAAASADLLRNALRRIADRGVSVSGDGPLGPTWIEGNAIDGAGVGIELRNASNAANGRHDTVSGCAVGLRLAGDSQAGAPGSADLDSMILWWCLESVEKEPAFALALTWSDVSGGNLWPGEGNILADPLFRDPLRGDFGLAAGSPCLGAGKDGSDMGATGAVPASPAFLRGDSTGDGALNITDAIAPLDYLFRGVGALRCLDAADTDDNGLVNLTDVVVLLNHLFRGGPEPAAPYPEPGPDPTEDGLECGG